MNNRRLWSGRLQLQTTKRTVLDKLFLRNVRILFTLLLVLVLRTDQSQ